MNLNDANPVVMHVKTAAAEGNVKCLTLFVRPAVKIAKSLSSLGMTAPSIAAIASQTKDRQTINAFGRFLFE